jgi:sulfotransferase family protein
MDRTRFTRAALCADASARTGLFDFGPSVDGWQDCLDVLVESTLAEAQLRDVAAFRDFVLHHLGNRLRIQAWLARVPAILATPVPRPLFISGLPRAGTTTFSRLLGEDPRIRSLRLWELHAPAPTDLAHPWALTEDRIAAAEQLVLARARQGTLAIRPISLFLADECFYLMRNSFDSDHLHRADARRPSYFHWLDRRDRAGTYAYYRRQIQLLLWQRGCPADGHVVLKNPFVHLENMRTIFQLFPDATLVNLTRDLASVVVSLCFKNRADRAARSDHVRSEDVGADMVENLDVYYRRRAAELDALTPAQRARVVTIDYDAWAGDPVAPVAIMRRVYELTGQPFTPELAGAMASALGRHARYGEQASYDLAEFGLRAEALRERFAPHEAAFRARAGVIA